MGLKVELFLYDRFRRLGRSYGSCVAVQLIDLAYGRHLEITSMVEAFSWTLRDHPTLFTQRRGKEEFSEVHIQHPEYPSLSGWSYAALSRSHG